MFDTSLLILAEAGHNTILYRTLDHKAAYVIRNKLIGNKKKITTLLSCM